MMCYTMNLTLQFMAYGEIENLDSTSRVAKLIDLVKQQKIILLEGRLSKEEEIELIKMTMEQIDESFKGVEIGTIEPSTKKSDAFFAHLKSNFIDMLLGDRRGITIIGPASVVKEIKQDPEKIQLFTQDKHSMRIPVANRKRR